MQQKRLQRLFVLILSFLKINFTNKALLTVYWQNYKFYFWCLHTLVIYFRFGSHDAFYRFLANQRNIQILDVEHEKIRDSCQALFQPMPKLEEGLILRLICTDQQT